MVCYSFVNMDIQAVSNPYKCVFNIVIVNPLMAVAAIWRFEVITRAAVCLNPADMYLYAFQCSMRLF